MPTILTFSEVPTDLVQLQLDPVGSQQPDATTPPNPKQLPDKPKSKISQHRKPSPGLAARLKALGFGYNKESPPRPTSSHAENIGRLPEDQLRQLDQKHLASSSSLSIERRGRPWKGVGAPLSLLRSRSSKRDLSQPDSSDDGRTSSLLSEPELLPEIRQTPPLEMDTNKYRLPDHTNGNGTKVQLDIRKEHLERDVRASEPAFPDIPPPPPPKDPPLQNSAPTDYTATADVPSYFNPLGLQRSGSIYTISRASFANQLAQLTALQLPDAELLSSKVSAIPTAQAAVKALLGAAEQIRSWISKASEVIGGLESEDDVEWAAAGGREGYTEVENAIARFEELINVYVGAIEELQGRDDIAKVSSEDLTKAVMQMESIMNDWRNIRTTLNNAKGQVETAMEWEELWNMVLGDIQNELDDLGRLVFEMEERRHKSIIAVEKGEAVDIGDLETIVEETPPALTRSNRFSLPAYPVTPTSPVPQLTQDDSSLLALFARMQPLRASLDFLPMRLSVFQARAEQAFPTACDELEMRRTALEGSYKKLEKDAESLRKELGEDKWVLVFRGAGRQAQKMIESVDRSMGKLHEGVDQRLQLTNPPAMTKKIESYEAKRIHYGPAIERVLSIIDRGVKDRLTVNGEILRLHTELQSRWKDVKSRVKETDATIEEIQAEQRSQQLRDSVSSMLSNDMSTVASGNETPGSSPPSSVVMSSLGLEPITPVYKNKSRSASMGSSLPQPQSARRSSSNLAPPSQTTRRPLSSRLSTLSNAPNPLTPARSGSATPVAAQNTRLPRSSAKPADNRPKWNSSVNTNNSDVGHNFKPLTLTTPSPYARTAPPTRPLSSLASISMDSKLPTRSPLSREASSSPAPDNTPSKSRSRLGYRNPPPPSPGPYSQQATTRSRLTSQPSSTTLNNRRASLQPPRPRDSVAGATQRPVSSLATGRRTSLLPQPRTRPESSLGRQSPQAVAGARSAMRKSTNASEAPQPKDYKPRWHF